MDKEYMHKEWIFMRDKLFQIARLIKDDEKSSALFMIGGLHTTSCVNVDICEKELIWKDGQD